VFDSVQANVTRKLERTRGCRTTATSRQPGLSVALRAGLEPLVRDRARVGAQGRGGAAARAHRLALQPAPRRPPLRRARFRRHRAACSRSRNGPGGADRRALGRLDGGHPARRARGAPPGAGAGAAAPCRFLQRRCAGGEVLARRDRGSEARARRPAGAVHADDRHHALRALRRAGRPSGAAAAVCQCGLAEQPAGVQPVQVQLVPGQRGAPVLSPDRCAAGADPAPVAGGPVANDAAGADLPVGDRLHR